MTDFACQTKKIELFDGTTIESTKRGLNICLTECATRTTCLLKVEPVKSLYSGIAGGYVWENGKIKKWSIKDDGVLREYEAIRESNLRA